MRILRLPECWVVSKLHMLIDLVTTSYDKYYLGDVARETYDFFWGDFADWYIEASKARLYQSGDNSATSAAQAVLLYVFENILKILHPFMPFVTEALWQKVETPGKDQDELHPHLVMKKPLCTQQAIPNQKVPLIVSSWPETSLPSFPNVIKRFENFQALVTRAIRNARAEYSVEPVKRISATIIANPDVLQYMSEEKEVLALLSKLDLQALRFAELLPEDANQSIHLVASEGLEAYLPLADMVDITAELQRLHRRLLKMEGEYKGLKARLGSPQFVEKAPEAVVRAAQEKAAEMEEKIILTKNRITFLESTTSKIV
ncbi:Valine--tRNA ligase chloroplastic/mitochondrial 2 [Bienertia sinuspersici]